MEEVEVRKRVAAGEDSRTEFKRVDGGVLPSSDDVAKPLVAFANSGGGDLFFGVSDDGSISGIGGRRESDALQRHVIAIASTGITPPLRSLRLFAVDLDAKLVLVVRVPEFLPERPFRGKSKYFIRDGPSSREARPDELKHLLTSAPIHYFDEQAIDSAQRTELDDEVVDAFLRAAYSAARREQLDRYLVALHAVDPAGRPTVTGLVLFGREPTRFLVGAYVSAVRFAGARVSRDFADAMEIRGNVFDQIEQAVEFLTRAVPAPSHVNGLKRVGGGIPVEVWREAITNALTHRDYASPNQVRVFVFEDRVEIINPGELQNRLTVENIRIAGTKQPRNPHIASAVARRGLRENLGIGVPEILQLVAQCGLPEPKITVEAGDFRLTLFIRD